MNHRTNQKILHGALSSTACVLAALMLLLAAGAMNGQRRMKRILSSRTACVLASVMLVLVGGARTGQAMSLQSGGRRNPLIFNGEEVAPTSYPFGAILCFADDSLGLDTCNSICTGSLIAPGVVLTAAHCFNDYMDLYRLDNNFEGKEKFEKEVTSSYRVIFGVEKSGPHRADEGFGVKKIVVGEPFEWAELSSKWDIALIFLDTCNEEVEPIKMLQEGAQAQASGGSGSGSGSLPSELSILGWGDSESFCVTPFYETDYHDPLQLMKYNHESCGDLEYCKLHPDRCDESLTVCLGQNNVASCNGDSGGPIFVEVPSSEPAQEQVVRKQEGSGSEVEVRSVADPPSGGTSFVQVGVLSSGEIITTGPSRWSSRFFKDQATGAKITAYTSWLKEHLATDICLEKKGLSVEDLFVDASILQNANLD